MTDSESRKTGSLVKVLEMLGMKDPANVLEKLFTLVKVAPGELNQGSLDIQAMYTEIEQAVMDAGLERLTFGFKSFLKDNMSRFNTTNVRHMLDSLHVKDVVDGINKLAEIANVHATYAVVKENLDRAGVPGAGRKVKQLVEESVLQERIEDFESYLADIGIADPRGSIHDLFEAAGLGGAFNEIKALLGWDKAIPV